jgi:hypothetical protein
MARLRTQLSTGLPELDHVFRGLMAGDNLVWQVDTIDDYLPFVVPYAAYARTTQQKLVYFRFAEHKPLLEAGPGVKVHSLDPQKGFEPFLSEVHHVIDATGRAGMYVFDCLSELAADWCSDRMLGNFFMLTCPYLYDRAAIAYFAILRNFHSFHAVRPITNTTQILVNIHRHAGKLYIHPIKVQYRHSTTMYMLHVWDNDAFTPVTQSGIITEILSDVPWSRLDSATYMLGYWSKTFAEAEQIQKDLEEGQNRHAEAAVYFRKILRMLISHDEPILRLAEAYLTLRDLIDIRRRMIGTGLIGGKTVGMLLARAILRAHEPRWRSVLEVHDSFYVGADVFYTYLVQNGCWWMIQKQKNLGRLDDESETARRRILAGEFPDYIIQQFADMLDYFGQSPIIVRSSSLLEDNYGNAFAGKYESVFCANQGGQHKRLEDFLFAVRTVYASTMGEDALAYRAHRGLLGVDEQMALLIQRVSGNCYGRLFYPQAAGVAFSYNPYAWDPAIDPHAGVLRLVFGVGTRAVERADDDYTRLVALNAPERRPETNFEEVREYSQHRVDVLDLEANQLVSTRFDKVLEQSTGLPVELFASPDYRTARPDCPPPAGQKPDWVLTFDPLLTATDFVKDMREMLRVLEDAYRCPVDVEFTLNFFDSQRYRINLVQCRPLQARGEERIVEPPANLPPADVILRARGAIIGKSAVLHPDWLIYVEPEVYSGMPDADRHLVARHVGDLVHAAALAGQAILLMGPGRWGTRTPSLGIPVSFSDIDRVAALCEIVAMRDDLIPDVSLGTHFLNELVELDILYLALFPAQGDNYLNTKLLAQAPNRITDLLPDAAPWAKEAIRVIHNVDILPANGRLVLTANTVDQRVVCYVQRGPPHDAPESARNGGGKR